MARCAHQPGNAGVWCLRVRIACECMYNLCGEHLPCASSVQHQLPSFGIGKGCCEDMSVVALYHTLLMGARVQLPMYDKCEDRGSKPAMYVLWPTCAGVCFLFDVAMQCTMLPLHPCLVPTSCWWQPDHPTAWCVVMTPCNPFWWLLGVMRAELAQPAPNMLHPCAAGQAGLWNGLPLVH